MFEENKVVKDEEVETGQKIDNPTVVVVETEDTHQDKDAIIAACRWVNQTKMLKI